MSTHQDQVERAATEVERFAAGQLAWMARRGPRIQRQAARELASLLPRLAADVRAGLSRCVPAAPQEESTHAA